MDASKRIQANPDYSMLAKDVPDAKGVTRGETCLVRAVPGASMRWNGGNRRDISRLLRWLRL